VIYVENTNACSGKFTNDKKSKKPSINSYLNNLWPSGRVQEQKETQKFPISRLTLQGLLKDHTSKKLHGWRIYGSILIDKK
jgi:hypothetical protein